MPTSHTIAASGQSPARAARILSLCSGYGGLDLGLLAVIPGHVVAHAETDPHATAVLARQWPGVPNIGDITCADWSEVGPVDWITAGYPCQPFSAAGKRQGANDSRNLWPAVARALRDIRPRRALLENVAGHVSLGLDQVLADLAALGYDARWGVVRASDAGAPHRRARVFILAEDADGAARGQRRLTASGEAAGRRSRTDPRGRGRASAADAAGARRQGQGPEPSRLRLERGGRAATGPSRDAGRIGDGDDGAAADAARDGRYEGRAAPAWLVRRPDVAFGGAAVADVGGERLGEQSGRAPGEQAWPDESAQPSGDRGSRPAVDWGPYVLAIRRWERLTRPAPRPTEPGLRGRERLSPAFVEWLMGLAPGWVVSVDGTPRNAQLRALGNGVVPQQASLAVRLLLQERLWSPGEAA